jgi:hypothetical protein
MGIRVTLTILLTTILSMLLTYLSINIAIGNDRSGQEFWGFIMMGCFAVSIVNTFACLTSYLSLLVSVRKNIWLLMVSFFGLFSLLNIYFFYALLTSNRKEIEDTLMFIFPFIIFTIGQVFLFLKARQLVA